MHKASLKNECLKQSSYKPGTYDKQLTKCNNWSEFEESVSWNISNENKTQIESVIGSFCELPWPATLILEAGYISPNVQAWVK